VRLFRVVVLLTAAAIVVFSAGIALGHPPANAVRALPDTVERGETFNVYVNFTAPADNFSAIALLDFAPAGWNVTGAWGTPSATEDFTGNEVGYMWWQHPYSNGTNFIALYQVKVPCNASLTNYTFNEDSYAYLVYVIGNQTQIWEDIMGDSNVTVVPPAICSTPSIDFYAAYNGTNPPNQTLEVWSSTPCMLNWSLSDDAGWLEEYPTNGSCTDAHVSVNLSVNASGMPLGNYTANISIQSPDANNSPRIVPVSLHITLTGTLKGQVNFIGRETSPDDKWIEPFVVRFFDDEGGEMLWSPINATTDDTGLFTISGIPAAPYDIGIKNSTCVSELVTNVTINVGACTEVDFGEIREGDANNDDYITISDRTLLYTAWGTGEGDPGWNANCDFNRDGYLTISDRTLLYDNWGQSGDLAP
jgi:hypothetical protein